MMKNLTMAVSWVLVVLLFGLANGQPKDGDVRISNKGYTSTNAGVVEVYFNGEFGLVCADDYWNLEAATVVCRQAGFAAAIHTVPPNEYYDPTLDPFQRTWLKDIYCNGDESTLAECVEYKPTASVSCPVKGMLTSSLGIPIASVLCADVRLVDTSKDGFSGRVEVYNEGQWYGFCGKNRWGENVASVICNMLFPWNRFNLESYTVPYTSTDKAVPDVTCSTGSEDTLHDCRINFDSKSTCDTRGAVSCVGEQKKTLKKMDSKDDLKGRAAQLLLQLLEDKNKIYTWGI